MRRPVIWLGLAVGCALAGIAVFPRGGGAREGHIAYDIRPEGNARFLAVTGEERRPLWTVSCRVPLRGCVARGQGLILSADRAGRLRLMAYVPGGARVALVRNGTSREMPHLLRADLADADLLSLSLASSELTAELGPNVILRAPLDGIGEVAAYLRWLAQAADRGERDARAWSATLPDETALLDHGQPGALPVVDPALWPQPVPRTKPQVEFAIRAQAGDSFFDPTGQ